MLSSLGIGAPEKKPDPALPMCAVSKSDQKDGVPLGEVCRVKYIIPPSFEAKVAAKALWIGCYKNGEGLAVTACFRPTELKGYAEMHTKELEVGASYVFTLKEGEVWPLITTFCTTNKIVITAPLLDNEASKTPVLKARSSSQPHPVAIVETMNENDSVKLRPPPPSQSLPPRPAARSRPSSPRSSSPIASSSAPQPSASAPLPSSTNSPPSSPRNSSLVSSPRNSDSSLKPPAPRPSVPAPLPPGRNSPPSSPRNSSPVSSPRNSDSSLKPPARPVPVGQDASSFRPPARPAPVPNVPASQTRARGNSAPTRPMPRPASTVAVIKAPEPAAVRESWGSPAPERREVPALTASGSSISTKQQVFLERSYILFHQLYLSRFRPNR